jgi:hypothetical protein
MNDDVRADQDLEEFLTHWYGPPHSEPLVPEGAQPFPLRCWYGYAEAWEQELAKQNRILHAPELSLADGKTVFYVAEHGSWMWGYGGGANPEVFDRDSSTAASWAPTGERLDMFLWHVAVFEAAFSGPYNLAASDLSLQEIELCTGLLDLCPFKPWRFPGPLSRLWSNDDLIVLTCSNTPVDGPVTDDSRWALFVGGRTSDALEELNGIGISWDFDSRSVRD